MEKTEYTVQEAYVIETIFKKPNIKQIHLASHCLISSRILRKVINAIRKKGWITTLR
jgi:DNA-binding MarR family transcriptional regulator